MSATLLRRIARMSREEVSFRTLDVARRHAERLRVVAREPHWERRDLARVLDPAVLDGALRDAISGGRWDAAGNQLLNIMRRRPSRHVLDARNRRDLSAEIVRRWPSVVADARERGDAILAGRFDLLGYRSLSFASDQADVDWHFDPVHQRRAPRRFWADVPFLDPACGDHKVIWELNRHQYFLALGRACWLTGDRRYATRIIDDVRSWCASNPPLVGINWASSLELAFRCLSWLSAIQFVIAADEDDGPVRAGDTGWLSDVLVGIDAQLHHVERHLSRYFSPNTHLTGEALGLYVAGAALPELRRSRDWMTTGRNVLLQEIDRQICADGGHVELSTGYHRYTLDFYCLALLTAELCGDTAAVPAFRRAVERLSRYMGAFCGPDGLMPAIGDDDGGLLWPIAGRHPRDARDSLVLASVLTGRPVDGLQPSAGDDTGVSVPEEVLWLAWSARPAVRTTARLASAAVRDGAPLDAHHLTGTGYVVAHDVNGDQLTFDVGAHGFLNGGHAHADALSVTLSLGGAPFLIDPGTATYTMDPELRTRLRSSASHNTVTVNERSSAEPAGPFHWRTRAAAQLEAVAVNPAFLVAEATHDGYAPLAHRRLVVHGRDSGWLVVDWIDGEPDLVDSHWHFDPSWRLSPAPGGLCATHRSGARAWLLHDQGTATLFHGDAALGWCSPRYGSLVPTFAARIRWNGAPHEPHTTWIGADVSGRPPRLSRLALEKGAGPAAVAVQVDHADGFTRTLVRSAWASGRELRSDGQLVQVRMAGATASVSIMGASHLEAEISPFAQVSAAATMADLHVAFDDTDLELWATTPPPEMQLRLRESCRPRRARLNGREMLLDQGGATELTMLAAQWGAAGAARHHGTGRGAGADRHATDAAMLEGVSC